MRATTVMFVIATLVLAAPAAAGLRACNTTAKTVWVAIAWDQAPGQFASTITWGWIKVEPGDCASVQDQALETDGSVTYYALVRDSDGFWGSVRAKDEASDAETSLSGNSFCFKPADDFKTAELHALKNTPPLCERHDFFLLETNNQLDFTMTLIPP
jgi:uncharacterized membrane protein